MTQYVPLLTLSEGVQQNFPEVCTGWECHSWLTDFIKVHSWIINFHTSAERRDEEGEEEEEGEGEEEGVPITQAFW